ncbi:MAG: DNA-protecting protein DprA [Bdellovibrionales bacterium]|nr:DNA-protecting protein DprA [Bdellovibrionales bacterium]
MDFEEWLLATISWEFSSWKVLEFQKHHSDSKLCIKNLILSLDERFPVDQWIHERKTLFKECQEYGIQWVHCLHKDYPQNLLKLENPPVLLSYIGEMCWSDNLSKSLSVVGSRHPDPQSLKWMELHLSALLAQMPMTVISGGARGIDLMAHLIAMRRQCPTVAWMPSGLFQIYPNGLKRWMGDIKNSGGAFLSSFPPHQPMFKWQFHIRNELIAAFSSHLLVVEARRRSGTMVTAQKAQELDVKILVVPSSAMSLSGLGGLDLLADGATLIRDRDDLLVALTSGV